MNNKIVNRLACPYDHANLDLTTKSDEGNGYKCTKCKRLYPIIDEIPNFLPDELRTWTTNEILNTKLSGVKNEIIGVGNWKPGFRGWSPSFIIRTLSFGFGQGRVDKMTKGYTLDVG